MSPINQESPECFEDVDLGRCRGPSARCASVVWSLPFRLDRNTTPPFGPARPRPPTLTEPSFATRQCAASPAPTAPPSWSRLGHVRLMPESLSLQHEEPRDGDRNRYRQGLGTPEAPP